MDIEDEGESEEQLDGEPVPNTMLNRTEEPEVEETPVEEPEEPEDEEEPRRSGGRRISNLRGRETASKDIPNGNRLIEKKQLEEDSIEWYDKDRITDEFYKWREGRYHSSEISKEEINEFIAFKWLKLENELDWDEKAIEHLMYNLQDLLTSALKDRLNEVLKIEETAVRDGADNINADARYNGEVTSLDGMLANRIADIAEEMGDDYSEWFSEEDIKYLIDTIKVSSVWNEFEEKLDDLIRDHVEDRVDWIRKDDPASKYYDGDLSEFEENKKLKTEDLSEPVIVKFWETEEDRDEGLSEIYETYPADKESISKAIADAKHIMHLMDYASVEVYNEDTEETYYWTDGVDEEYSDSTKASAQDNTVLARTDNGGSFILVYDDEDDEAEPCYVVRYFDKNNNNIEYYGSENVFDTPEEATKYFKEILADDTRKSQLEKSISAKIKGSVILGESNKSELAELDRLQDELRGVDVSKLSDEEYKDFKAKSDRVHELMNKLYDFHKLGEGKTIIDNGEETYTIDKSAKTYTIKTPKGEKTFTFDEMNDFVNRGKGMNRIYKPMSVLAYTDFKNGNLNRWKTRQED